jgi:hypothetical protein
MARIPAKCGRARKNGWLMRSHPLPLHIAAVGIVGRSLRWSVAALDEPNYQM